MTAITHSRLLKIAAPIVLWWAKRSGKSIKREVLGDLPQAAS